MSLNDFFSTELARNNLRVSSELRIDAAHLRALDGAHQTMLRVDGVVWDSQRNKDLKKLPGEKGVSSRHAWAALVGVDALSGLPARLVIQSGALIYEMGQILGIGHDEAVSAFSPVGDPGADARPSPYLDVFLPTSSEGGSIVRSYIVVHAGPDAQKVVQGKAQVFPTFKLTCIRTDDTTVMERYREAWRADARSMRGGLVAQLAHDGE